MGRPKGSKNKEKEQPTGAVEQPEVTPPSEDTTITAPPAHKNRLSLLNEINDTNKERYASDDDAEETEESEKEVPRETPAKEETPSEDESDEVPEPVAAKPEETPPVVKRKLTIDGVEKELTETEIIALAQKAGAVDSRLAEATRILEDAKRRTATPTGAPPANAIPKDAAQPPASTDVEQQALISEISDAILYGDKDQVAAGFAKLLGTGRQTATPKGLSPNDIQRTVLETIAFERAKTALETPPDQGGFSDIWMDTTFRKMFEARENELRDGGDTRPYLDLYKHIAGELREWRDGMVKAHAPPTGLENRDQLKRASGIVRGGGGKTPVPTVTPPRTLEDKLADMRRTRGLN